jgi:DnaJ-class molecular chaperone
MVSRGKGIADLLNSGSVFLDFESHGGERSYIAKSQVAVLRLLDLAMPAPLSQRLNGLDELEPHRILGIEPEAEQEEIRQAYLRMAKGYHPDCYANVELPSEVKEYLAAMVRRINAAYAALEAPRQAEARRDRRPAATSRPPN